VIQPSSPPVDRPARRAKTDIIDVEMLLRTLMAWLRGEPRVCSMVPIPSEADEEARRAYREREDLTGERRSIVNKIDSLARDRRLIDVAIERPGLNLALVEFAIVQHVVKRMQVVVAHRTDRAQRSFEHLGGSSVRTACAYSWGNLHSVEGDVPSRHLQRKD
jgi:transposase